MSEQREHGGPAFPHKMHIGVRMEDGVSTPLTQTFPGMTLRDWFAGQALAGLLACASSESMHVAMMDTCRANGVGPPVVWATVAYEQADAMLAQRTTGQPTATEPARTENSLP